MDSSDDSVRDLMKALAKQIEDLRSQWLFDDVFGPNHLLDSDDKKGCQYYMLALNALQQGEYFARLAALMSSGMGFNCDRDERVGGC